MKTNKESKLLKLIEKQAARIAELEYLNEDITQNFHAYVWEALEKVLQDKKEFFYPDWKPLKVIDMQYEENHELQFKAFEIIGIVSYNLFRGSNSKENSKVNDRRNKIIFVNHRLKPAPSRVTVYRLNNNDMNFHALCNYLDPLSHRLVVTSESSIANVAFYKKIKGNKIELIKEIPELTKIKILPLSLKIGKENFIKVQNYYLETYSLQKRIFGYISGF